MSIVFLLYDSFSLLVRVLGTPLPLVALFRLGWSILRRGLAGTSVPHMLLAGASAGLTPAVVGALVFHVSASPSGADWSSGSANKYFKYNDYNNLTNI